MRLPAAAIASLLLMPACATPPAEAPTKVVLTLFDLSESTAKLAMRKAYLDAFRTIVATVRSGDALVAGWITEHSAAELVLPVRMNIPPFSPDTDNPTVIEAKRAAAMQAVRAETEQACQTIAAGLQNPGRKVLNTNILSSLTVAERVFKSFSQPRKVLVIMSDMLEDSEHYNFERLKLTAHETARIIEAEKRAGRLADLHRVRVYVIGASAPSDDKLIEVENFWRAYFVACGAELRKENYGAALVRFSEQ